MMPTVRSKTPFLVTFGLLLLGMALMYTQMKPERFVDLVVRGLTLGMLYFLVASGLSLIFGLMDVLNFAHGSLFMIGAYGAWSFFTIPQLFLASAPLLLAVAGGWFLAKTLHASVVRVRPGAPLGRLLPWLFGLLALAALFFGLRGLDLKALTAVNPLQGLPTPAAPGLPPKETVEMSLWVRVAWLSGAGLLAGFARAVRRSPRGEDRFSTRRLGLALALLVSGLLFLPFQENGPDWVLALNSDLRFVLALLVGTGLGALAGGLMETTLIRPLYERPLYQVLVTLGLTFVITQATRALFGPTGYQMAKPVFFDTPLEGRSCTSESLWAFLREHCVRVEILGAIIPSYRLFIIALGLVLLAAVGLLLQRSRLGIIIRAGVQDAEMVEALGIDVRRVFTLVFALGAGIAALGGAAAAPLLRVDPDIGLTYQLQAFIVVVLGGMGSFLGAAVGALVVGLAEAFSTYLVTSFRVSTSLATASTVIIMAVVLLVRPAGLFGKKE